MGERKRTLNGESLMGFITFKLHGDWWVGPLVIGAFIALGTRNMWWPS